MRQKMMTAVALVGMGVVGASAQADLASVSYSASVPVTGSDWTEMLSLPRFDPSLGDLESVTLSVEGSFAGSFDFENMSNGLFQVFDQSRKWNVRVLWEETRATELLSIQDEWTRDVLELAPFDGTIDFAGPSGNSDSFTGSASDSVSLLNLTDFIGGGSVSFTIDHDAPFSFNTVGGSYVFGAFSTAGVTLTITYDYIIPAPGSFAALVFGGLAAARRRR